MKARGGFRVRLGISGRIESLQLVYIYFFPLNQQIEKETKQKTECEDVTDNEMKFKNEIPLSLSASENESYDDFTWFRKKRQNLPDL